MTPEVRRSGLVDVTFGARVIVTEPCNLYGCSLGEDVFVGPFVEIQKRVRVGDCFVGHGVMFINDRFAIGAPAKGDRSLWEPTLVGNRVSIGSNSTILPVKICDGAVIGAGSVVTADVAERGIYAGNPARKIRSLP
jgi:acetyltransferase-like isoleucine patch superfamily enzyme